MGGFKKILRLFVNKFFMQKLFAYGLLIFALYLLRDFLLVLFLTFIFSYLFLTFWSFLKQHFDTFVDKLARTKKQGIFLKGFFSLNIMIVFVYFMFIGAIFFALSDLLPKITRELYELPNYMPALKEPIGMLTSKLEEIKNLNSEIWWSINEIFTKQDVDIILQVWEKLKAFGVIFFQVVMGLILSYIFIVDREKLNAYLKWIQSSNFWFLYFEYKVIFEKIVRTFWLVFKAQSMIALTNAILTTIWLFSIWLVHGMSFPLIYTLAIVVFVCGFIPVLWTFISSLPILLIWYTTYWWIWIIIEVVLLIFFIHAVEAYYLNPKIVSSYIKLPLSLTFLVLILSEHFMGIAGLVIWISSFYLLLELLKDADKIITKSRKTFSDMHELEYETKWNIQKSIRLSRKVNNHNDEN